MMMNTLHKATQDIVHQCEITNRIGRINKMHSVQGN